MGSPVSDHRGRSQKTPRQADAMRAVLHRGFIETVRWAVAQGSTVPCVQDPEGGWTSSDRMQRLSAAARCLECPLLDECRAYTTECPEPDGVWGASLSTSS
ncbi:WhiB family transcriptional regulator [Leifsonia sp. 22587]|uniref:WhiB family transcriptional regulator n=1 Tax=Leifsonia sp. 22587 TaxID=3453946 RepID=UPI003F871B03